MHLLLWIFMSLQFSVPLINVNTPQIARGDWQGGPIIRREIYRPVSILKINKNPRLYSCRVGIYINKPQACYYHNELKTQWCTFTVRRGLNIPCADWVRQA
jgi:hypothetical protein